MPDGLGAALAAPGLGWLGLVIFVAGIVRGFTGFGTGLIFVPIAGLFLPPADCVLIMALTGLGSTITLLPEAWGRADRAEVFSLAIAASLAIPAGLWLLTSLNPETVRWAVALVAGLTLLGLVSGWRYRGRVTGPGLAGVGFAAGLIGGMTGLTGPVVIFFYLAGTAAAAKVRANTVLFLAVLDLVVASGLFVAGQMRGETLWLSALLAGPYLIGTLVGKRLFDPARERAYRALAYGLIALAVLSGLPIWEG
ncbi:sulfite exporter TauE/SafE family protein [Poseidonocella sedimentorum]|uniref:Probable membrane transporter protein n=1 Tax=Poseidonocella sedimentorum TaxID=871652 RepID=A0A1I6DZC0_9RHOB|nr:sulfite exporter TauE/SafE family protein [Poseidonocella sedimentorum]SFR10880.1 hypothetical protein SAMN04515673_106131 [Poseidonocella sedimentorum]